MVTLVTRVMLVTFVTLLTVVELLLVTLFTVVTLFVMRMPGAMTRAKALAASDPHAVARRPVRPSGEPR